MKTAIWHYIAVMSAFTFFLYLFDKRRAKRKGQRVPEASLLGCSILGGAIGGLLAMFTVRHKTRKRYFRAINALFALVYLGVTVWAVLV